MKSAFIFLFVTVFTSSAFGQDWFNDPASELCKGARYHIQCRTCLDGCGGQRFVFKDSKKNYARHNFDGCGDDDSFGCGDSYEIEKRKELKCEPFVEELQKKQKDCKGCLDIIHEYCG